MTRPFRVHFTADVSAPDGRPKFADTGLDVLRHEPGIEVGRFAEHLPEVAPEQLAEIQAAIVLSPRVTARSLSHASNLLAIARFGVGYDSVDVAACTAADVVLCITAGAVDHSVAEATVGWMLALSHHVLIKDRIVREGRWQERSTFMGSELRNRTLGVIGFGGIGRAVVQMLAGFRMAQPLVYDPFVSPNAIAHAGAKAAALDELLAHADFVSIHCPLNECTRNLIGRRELSLMKPTAWLLNTARGGIVDEAALYAVLKERRIAGAAIDCFNEEPPQSPLPFAELDNVLLAPHAIAWTHELFAEIGRTACRSVVDLARGRRPHGVVNPEVFERPGFRAKWDRWRLV